jgi:hypothetical protein|tara:strand:- start:541 stop:750 length:210 start_codon:yes stop_codon:yes gene_type:complete
VQLHTQVVEVVVDIMMDVEDLVEQVVAEQEVIMELLQQELELLTLEAVQVDQEIIRNQQSQVQQVVQVS